MSFTQSTRGSHVDKEQLGLQIGGKGSVGCWILCLVSLRTGCEPGTNGIGMGCTTSGSQSIGGGLLPWVVSTKLSLFAEQICCGTCEILRTPQEDCFLFPCFLLYKDMQHRSSMPKEENNVMAPVHMTCPGRNTLIWCGRLTTSHRSLSRILPLNSTYTLTQIEVCNLDHSITVQILMRPDTGVHVLTMMTISSIWSTFVGKMLSTCHSQS